MSRPNPVLLFVYGTLRKNCCRNHVLKDTFYVGTAITTPEYVLYHLGKYPAMAKSDKGYPIHGELYEVDEPLMERLDHIEGAPVYYNRVEVNLDTVAVVKAPMNEECNTKLLEKKAVAYLFTKPETLEDDAAHPKIENGTWDDSLIKSRF